MLKRGRKFVLVEGPVGHPVDLPLKLGPLLSRRHQLVVGLLVPRLGFAVLREKGFVVGPQPLGLLLLQPALGAQLNQLRVRPALEDHQLLHRVPEEVLVPLALHEGVHRPLSLLISLPGLLLGLLHLELLRLAGPVVGRRRLGHAARVVLELGRYRRHHRGSGEGPRHLKLGLRGRLRLHWWRGLLGSRGRGGGRRAARRWLQPRNREVRRQLGRQLLTLQRDNDEVLRE